MPFFELQHTDKNSRARAGIIHTDHGDIATPVFMPVGTQATVKTLDQADLETLGAQIILGNTYHLHLRPGENLIAQLGGLHRFMSWDKPILTDSGGFQVFSLGLAKNSVTARKPIICGADVAIPLLTEHPEEGISRPFRARDDAFGRMQARLVSIDDGGVTFRSHLDGSTHRFTPEASIEIQHQLGADIIMAFDECTPDDDDCFNAGGYDYIKEAMERTHRWAKKSLEHHHKLQKDVRNAKTAKVRKSVGTNKLINQSTNNQYLFGIIQGANYKELREESAGFISSLDFDGIAIGGESIGYNMELTAKILDWVYPIIPENKPHYTMGVGLSPADLLIAIEQGADMFDCVGPTRLARHGMVFVGPDSIRKIPATGGQAWATGHSHNPHRLNIKNAPYARDTTPIDENCLCSTCQRYSRAYLNHLFKAEETTGQRLATLHNIHFMLQLMRAARQAILEDRFGKFKQLWNN